MQRQHPAAVSFIFLLAAAAVVAVAILGSTAKRNSTELLQEAKGLLLQKLDDMDNDDSGSDDSSSHKHCGEECLAKRRRIAAQMKALQRQINSDYKSMITFGHKAGYVPPVKSIKQQVMDGSLLSSGDDAAAPPPFDPNLHSTKAYGDDREKRLLRSEEPHHSSRRRSAHRRDSRDEAGSDGSGADHDHHHGLVLPRVRSVGEMAHKFMHEDTDVKPVTHHEAPHLARRVTFHSRHSTSGSAPNAKWKKLFSFMDKGPHDEAPKHVTAPRTTIPSAVRRAIQRALSFATSPHKSKTEKAGDQLLGLKDSNRGREGANKGKDPIQSSKFLRSYFGDGR